MSEQLNQLIINSQFCEGGIRSQPTRSAPLVEAPLAYHGFARNTHTYEMESSSRANPKYEVLMRIGCSKMPISSF